MIAQTAEQLSQPDLQIEYDRLAEKYYELKISHRKRAEKYNALLKSKRLLSKQIQRWSRRYQRLKLTIAASAIKTANFQDYAASFESSDSEIKRLEALVLDLSLKNCELEQSLEQSKLFGQAQQWQSKKYDGAANSQPIILNFPPQNQQLSSQQAASL